MTGQKQRSTESVDIRLQGIFRELRLSTLGQHYQALDHVIVETIFRVCLSSYTESTLVVVASVRNGVVA
jgi:hypothetical protein